MGRVRFRIRVKLRVWEGSGSVDPEVDGVGDSDRSATIFGRQATPTIDSTVPKCDKLDRLTRLKQRGICNLLGPTHHFLDVG